MVSLCTSLRHVRIQPASNLGQHISFELGLVMKLMETALWKDVREVVDHR